MKADTKKEKIMLSSEVQQPAGTIVDDAGTLYFAANDLSSFLRRPQHAVRYSRGAPYQFAKADALFGVAGCLDG